MGAHQDTRQVIRLEAPSGRQLEYADLVDASNGLREPVLLPGICAEKLAVETWTLDHLVSLEPETMVTAEYYPDGDRRKPYVHIRKPFSEIAADLAAQPKHWFLAELNFDEVFSQAANQLPALSVLPQDAREILRLVFFGTDTQSATHFHVRDQAILEHLRGQKRVVLTGPKTTDRMATNSPFGGRPQFSTLGPEAGQDALERFTEIVGNEAMSVDLEPGDGLFIPVHWWHWAEGFGESLSVTTFWRAAYSDWTFPHPGIRAGTAVALGSAARLVRAGLKRIGRRD